MFLLVHGIMLLLDLFIYLNFEQKQQESPFVDIYNLHGINIAPAVPLYYMTSHLAMGVMSYIKYFDKKNKAPSEEGASFSINALILN